VNVGLDGVIYSDRVSNLLIYLGAESAVSSEIPLKSLGIRLILIPPFESSRPSQLLANEIKHFLKSFVFYSDARPMLGIFPAMTRE
jgi:hypothetical protein